jgi:hypothetical protein
MLAVGGTSLTLEPDAWMALLFWISRGGRGPGFVLCHFFCEELLPDG